MPTDQDTLYRLLNLYPIEALKANWELKGKTKNDVITEILSIAKETQIFTFCKSFQEVTKQHLFLFGNDAKAVRSFPNPLLSEFVATDSKRISDRIQEFYLVPVTFKVVVGPPYRDIELKFLWPVSILVEPELVIVTLTILEKKIDAYVPAGETALNTQRDLDEDSILTMLEDGLPNTVTLTELDLNKGIKKLWRSGKIDAPFARWKPDKSTVTQTMDGNYLLKRDDPDAFEKAIKEPLLKTLFVLVYPDVAERSTHFSVSPSDGEIMFNRYSKSEEVANVVRAILTAN